MTPTCPHCGANLNTAAQYTTNVTVKHTVIWHPKVGRYFFRGGYVTSIKDAQVTDESRRSIECPSCGAEIGTLLLENRYQRKE